MTAPENPTSNVEQAIGDVLAAHYLVGFRCMCGWTIENAMHGQRVIDVHPSHVAEQVAAVVAGVRAEALRDAADAWQREHPPLGQGGVPTWLRARADGETR